MLKRLFLAFVALAMLVAAPLRAEAKLDDKEWSKAKSELTQALGGGNADAIVSAVEKVGQDQSKRAVELLVQVGAKLDDIKVYDAVKRALAGMSEPEAVTAMVKSLGSSGDWQVRCVLVDCLAEVKTGEGVTAAMVKALDDQVPYVISQAAKALGRRKDKDAIAGLITKLAKLEKSKDVVWVDVKQGLTDITGEDFADAKEWLSWWDGVKATWDPAKRGSKDESSTTLRPGEESGGFFTEPIVAKRIMFVIDVSGSMEAKDIPVEGKGTQSRIQVVKDELVRCVKGLKKDVQFNIIAFSDKMKYWQKVEKNARALVPANDGMKADAIKWITGMKAEGATHTDDALKKAFEPLEVNQIIILSDGAPAKFTGGQQAQPTPTGPILEMVKGLNRLRGVKINTFCFKIFEGAGGGEELLKFMEDLAVQNGGKLVLCPGGGVRKGPKKEPEPQPAGGDQGQPDGQGGGQNN